MRTARKKIPRCCVWVWGEGRAAGTRRLALMRARGGGAERHAWARGRPGHASALSQGPSE